MKARRIRVIKDFLTVKAGAILPVRPDVGQSLVEQGLGEWVLVEIKNDIKPAVIQAPIVSEPIKPEPNEPIAKVQTEYEMKRAKRKPAPKENKQLKSKPKTK